MKRVAAMAAVTLCSAATLAAQLPPIPLIPPGGLWGPIAGAAPSRAAATPSLPLAPAPRSTTDMATVNPAATVTIDNHDTPVEASVADAQKSGTNIQDHAAHEHPAPATPPQPQAAPAQPATPSPDPHAGHTHTTTTPDNPTTRQPDNPATKQPSNPATQQPKPTPKPRPPAPPQQTAIYACPMHPEVTSTKPGTCPKCGMSLVKK